MTVELGGKLTEQKYQDWIAPKTGNSENNLKKPETKGEIWDKLYQEKSKLVTELNKKIKEAYSSCGGRPKYDFDKSIINDFQVSNPELNDDEMDNRFNSHIKLLEEFLSFLDVDKYSGNTKDPGIVGAMFTKLDTRLAKLAMESFLADKNKTESNKKDFIDNLKKSGLVREDGSMNEDASLQDKSGKILQALEISPSGSRYTIRFK